MCELFALSSLWPANINFSLEEFSKHGGQTDRHRDGWGIAYYSEEDVRLIKEPQAAAASDLIRFVEDHDIRSTLVLSHLRSASHGEPKLKNTQPFTRELVGRVHTFAHNGDLHGIEGHSSLRIGSHVPVGGTDSEYAFCALLHEMRPIWKASSGVPPLKHRFDVVTRFARKIRRLGTSNFIYCDGDTVFAHGDMRRPARLLKPRPPGLFILRRSCTAEPRPFVARGLSIESDQGNQEVVLIASVPLTEEGWLPLAKGEVVAIRAGRVEVRQGSTRSQNSRNKLAAHTSELRCAARK